MKILSFGNASAVNISINNPMVQDMARVPVQPMGLCDNYYNKPVDMKTLYSQDELDAIVARFDCLHSDLSQFGVSGKCNFDMTYLPASDSIVINNQNMTNDTVEIDKDGKAISVGSWHRKELEGNYSDIINDTKLRVIHTKANVDFVPLDCAAQLGKSQVK